MMASLHKRPQQRIPEPWAIVGGLLEAGQNARKDTVHDAQLQRVMNIRRGGKVNRSFLLLVLLVLLVTFLLFILLVTLLLLLTLVLFVLLVLFVVLATLLALFILLVFLATLVIIALYRVIELLFHVFLLVEHSCPLQVWLQLE